MNTSNFYSLFQNMRKVAFLAFPISLNMLINMLSGFISMSMVAELGNLELAAGALAVATFMAIFTVVITIFYAVGILISHYRGEEKSPTEIGMIIKNGFWLALAFSIPSIICLRNIDHLLIFAGQDPILVAITIDYFYYGSLSIFPMLIWTVIYQFYFGLGNPRFTMMISIASLPVLISLSYIFILGKFNFPQLGLAGITLSTLIVNTLFSVSLLLHLYFGKNTQKYQIFGGKIWPNMTLCKNILRLGLPIGIQFGGELSAMAVSTYFIGYFGVIPLAASQIVSQWTLLVVMVSLGLSQALSILISEAHSKQNFPLIKQYLNSSLLILALFFGVVFIGFILMPESLINVYMGGEDPNQKELIDLAVSFFVIAGITLLFDGIRNLFAGGLRALRDSKTPMNIGVICLWLVSLPLCYIIAFPLKGGPVGLRIGFSSGFIIAAVWLWGRMQRKMKINVSEDILSQSV